MSSYHDHKVAGCYLLHCHCLQSFVRTASVCCACANSLFFWASFTLYIKSVSCLWLWDCSLSLVQPKRGEWPLPPPGFWISHLGPDMFNRVHICFLTQWVVVPLLPLHLFFCTKKWHWFQSHQVTFWTCFEKKGSCQKEWQFVLNFHSLLCCAVKRWKEALRWLRRQCKNVTNTQHVSFMFIVLA